MGVTWGEKGYMKILNSGSTTGGPGIIGLNRKLQIPQTNNFGEGDHAITVSNLTQLSVAILALALSF